MTVSSSGLVTAVSAGSANFTATVSGQTSPPYTITSAAPQISLSSDNLATAGNITSLTAGSVNQLTATCNYSDGSSTNCSTADSHGNDASFSSTAAGVATVSASGLATAVAAGTTILQAAVQFGAAQANWGGTQENTTGVTFAGSINETYFVLGSQSGGYTTQSCSFFLPSSTLTVGAKFDCGLISATTPTSQASSWLCYGTYTVTSASAPNAWVIVPMSGCGTLAAGSAWWVALSTNQSGPVTTGYYNCSGSCSGAAPSSPGTAPGSGTYSCGYVSGISYGVYSGIPTSVTEGCGPGGTQASQYVTLGQPPITSNTVSLTVTASAPTLVSAALTASGSPSTLTVGQTLQFAAKCTYSDGSVTDCTVADIWGNKVTQWQSSQPVFVSINSAGLATAIAAGAAQLSANIGSLVSSAYALTAQAVAVTLANVSLNTTGGVTGLFVGSTNHLIATCLYSDNSTTICTSTDSHGNKASGYTSSNPAIATVNATSGLVTGVAPGTTNLTATAGGKTSSPRAVTVLAVPMGVYTITISGPVKFSGRWSFEKDSRCQVNNTSPLSQNLAASGGGIIPFSIVLGVLAIGPGDPYDWVRITSHVLAALVSLLICHAVFGFISDRKAGHKWLHALALVYFGSRAVVHVWVATDHWLGGHPLPVLLSTLSNGAEIVFGMFYYVTRGDLSNTYRRSEAVRQANIRRLDNIGQAALNLEWIAQMQAKKSHQLTEMIGNVGRGG